MGAKKKTARKSGKRKKGKKSKKGRSRLGLFIGALIPMLAVGGFLAYHSSQPFQERVDRHWQDANHWFAAQFGGESTPQASSSTTRPDDQSSPEKIRLPSLPEPDENGSPLPRQATRPATFNKVAVEVHAAQSMARKLFGGEVTSSQATARAFWYRFTVKGATPAYPFDVKPVNVDVSTLAYRGEFLKELSGFVVFVRASNPSAPEGRSTFVGAALFSGTPLTPGKLLRRTAMQASDGTITRHEVLDFQGDGVLELVLEVESAATGGYQFRDLAVVDFAPNGTRFLWTTRTLDDGPGALAEKAHFKRVTFEDKDSDGVLDIQVERGRRTYRVNDDFTRSLLKEQMLGSRDYRLVGRRFKVVAQ